MKKKKRIAPTAAAIERCMIRLEQIADDIIGDLRAGRDPSLERREKYAEVLYAIAEELAPFQRGSRGRREIDRTRERVAIARALEKHARAGTREAIRAAVGSKDAKALGRVARALRNLKKFSSRRAENIPRPWRSISYSITQYDEALRRLKTLHRIK